MHGRTLFGRAIKEKYRKITSPNKVYTLCFG
jgi:hypothetical protein